ncbi:carboxypeptidase-like regulatory domain-containing protein [Streptomyces aquilus]|uniref:carboxypeptidase-like regulatory domain-containing protein n=1 Tax=Streptomyces aquilus TaxID=2548456 RepID=UPI0037D2E5AF
MKPKFSMPLRRWTARWLGVVVLLGGLPLIGACGDSPDDSGLPTRAGTTAVQEETEAGDTSGDEGDSSGDVAGQDDGLTEGLTEGSTDGLTEGSADGGADGGYNLGIGANTVSGVVVDGTGSGVEGVQITFYTVPRSGFYETYSLADGSYTYQLPDGVYQTFAFYGEPDSEMNNFYPVGLQGGSSFTVPPDQEINFGWGPQD